MTTTPQDNIIPFDEAKLALAAGERPPPYDWVYNLPQGSVFLCRPKTPEWKGAHVECWRLVNKTKRSVLLGTVWQEQESVIPVDSQRFSAMMELFEILHTGGEDG